MRSKCAMTRRNAIDWGGVEADFRAGILSNRQIAKKHGASEAAIRKRAMASGWVRTKMVGPSTRKPPIAEILPPRRAGDERKASASCDADHVTRGQDIALRLLAELDAVTSHLDEIEDAIWKETKDDVNGRRRAAMLKAVSLPARSMTLKTIAQAVAVMKEVDNASGAKGKRAEQAEKAKEVARGRFAPPSPPRLIVDNA